MLTSSLALVVLAASPSATVEVSPEVKALVAKHGTTFGPELEKGLETLRAQGDRTAAALLGEILMMPGRTGGPDYSRSCAYSEAAGRHASALHNLATCYFNGQGRPRDMAKARELYGRAAGMGFPKASCALGNMLISGTGGPPDVQRGLDLCREAADAGEPDAQTDFGGYLLTNKYISKNAVEARRYLSQAAEKGQPNAAFLLGQIYWNGDGVEKDLAAAAKWWKIAYEGGRADAARLLGAAALRQISSELKANRSVPAVVIGEAKQWFSIAAERDPNPDERRKASEAFKLIAELERRSK